MIKVWNVNKASLSKSFSVVVGVISVLFAYASYAQDIPSVKVVQGELVSPDAAVLYFKSINPATGGLSTPSGEFNYHPHEDSRLQDIAQSLGYNQTKWAALSGTELIKAHNDYVDAAYEYARNGVEFTPMFGLHHGAMGAAIFGAGTAADHTHLLVELMHVAGITAKVRLGVVAPSAAEFKAWFGTDIPLVACRMLADGGIPAEVNGAASCDSLSGYASDPNLSISMLHIWARITIDGTEYSFDAAKKKYQTYEGSLDMASLAGITASGTQAAIGGSVTGDTYTSFNPKTLNTYLNERSQALLTELKKDENAGVSLNEAIGGRRLIVESGAPRDAILPTRTAVKGTWSNTPPELTASIEIDVSQAYGVVQDSITLPLQKIGADFVAFSPIVVSGGGADTDITNVFNREALFELSILRPGSRNHEIHANTGYNRENEVSGLNTNNTPSGDNLFILTPELIEIINGGFMASLDFNFPGAAYEGAYLNHYKKSIITGNVTTAFIIRSGETVNSNLFYERSIPEKTNLWTGTYNRNRDQANECADAEADYARQAADGFGYLQAYNAEYSASYIVPTAPTGCSIQSCTIHGCSVRLDQTCSMNNAASYQNALEGAHAFADTMARHAGNNASDQNELAARTRVEQSCIAVPGTNRTHYIATDKHIRLKSMILDKWHKQSVSVSHLNAGLAKGAGIVYSSLGFISQTANLKADLTADPGEMWIDVDTAVGFVPTQSSSSSKQSFAISNAAGLSAIEKLVLQSMIGTPRVDSAISKLDWYAWNASYNPVSGVHAGPYKRNYVEGVDVPNGTPSVNKILDSGFTVVQPSRDDLGPVEAPIQLGPDTANYYYPDHDTYIGRIGREKMQSVYRYDNGTIFVAHTYGYDGKKGGGGVKLPEFASGPSDAGELEKQEFGKSFGDFSVDPGTGSFTFALPADISIGSGADRLDFVRTYESVNAGNGPFGQGWSHNFDTKIVMTTNLTAGLEGPNPRSVIAAIITGLAVQSLVDEVPPSDIWVTLPQSLLVNAWLARNMLDGEIVITTGGGSDTFYTVPITPDYVNGAARYTTTGFTNLNNITAELTQTGHRKFYEGMRLYNNPDVLTEAFGQVPGQVPAGLFIELSQNPLFERRNWVSYEQYFDYSNIDFIYTASDKSRYTFTRKPPDGLENWSTACPPPGRRAYVNQDHSQQYCGKGIGMWSVDNVISPTGQEMSYLQHGVGGPLEIQDERYGRSIFIEYDAIEGALEFANLDTLIENNHLGEQAGLADYVTQGQGTRVKRVYTGEGETLREVIFYYDESQQRTTSPLLTSYQAVDGQVHHYEYTPLAVGDMNPRYQKHYLTSFTPATRSVPFFTLEYDDAARVTKIIDADGYATVHGTNGARNRTVDPIGNETIRLYDPDGRLIEQIEPSYEGDAP